MATDLGFEPVETGSYYFISYDTGDRARVSEYVLKMHADGLRMWYDKGIHAGTNWEGVIAEHIEGCEGVILFLSKSPFKKEKSFVRTEFNIATAYRKRILIVLLDEITRADVPHRYQIWYQDLCDTQGIPAYGGDGLDAYVGKIYGELPFEPGKKQKEGPIIEPIQVQGGNYAPLSSSGFVYDIGGLKYSDDVRMRARFPGARPLDNALEMLFLRWMTSQVFILKRDGSIDFNPGFLNLLRIKRQPLDGKLIEEILRGGAERDKKQAMNRMMFRLFYEVAYPGDEGRAKGFYWSDAQVAVNLSPIFRDFDEFSRQFYDQTPMGDTLRKLYATRRRELEIFFGLEKGSNIMDQAMIAKVAQSGEILWFDNESQTTVDFGRLENFVEKMKVPMPATEAKRMVAFLRNFRISLAESGNGDYVLTQRKKATNLLKEIYPNTIGDEPEVFKLLGMEGSNGSTAYAHYLTLLVEHAKTTGSRTFEIETKDFGTMQIDSAHPEEDIKRAVRQCMELELGDELSEEFLATQRQRRVGYLQLIKSMIACEIFGDVTEDTYAEYFEAARAGKSAAVKYLEWFGNDAPVVLWRDEPLSVEDYIERNVADKPFDELERFLTERGIAAAYLERNADLNDAVSQEMSTLLAQYDAKYEVVLNAFATAQKVDPHAIDGEWDRRAQEMAAAEYRRLAESISIPLTVDGSQGKIPLEKESTGADKPEAPSVATTPEMPKTADTDHGQIAETDVQSAATQTEPAPAPTPSGGSTEPPRQITPQQITPQQITPIAVDETPFAGERRARKKKH